MLIFPPVAAVVLDRIGIDRSHIAGSIDPVNPVTSNKVEQIHAVDGIADGDSNQPRSALISPRPAGRFSPGRQSDALDEATGGSS
jgi:hypothetical protein